MIGFKLIPGESISEKVEFNVIKHPHSELTNSPIFSYASRFGFRGSFPLRSGKIVSVYYSAAISRTFLHEVCPAYEFTDIRRDNKHGHKRPDLQDLG